MKKKILLSSIVAVCLVSAFVAPRMVNATTAPQPYGPIICSFVGQRIPDEFDYGAYFYCNEDLFPLFYRCFENQHFSPIELTCTMNIASCGHSPYNFDHCRCSEHYGVIAKRP